ncbi:MAG TPA: hypothetical protein VF188_07650 [Longimicrobiales bacterium]
MRDVDVARIVGDPRLTPDAVRVVLYVATRGDGEHEIDACELMALLRCKSDKPVRNAVRLAETYGYLRCRQGGRDHPNRYTYLCPVADVSETYTSQGAEVKDTPPQGQSYPTYSAHRAEVSAITRDDTRQSDRERDSQESPPVVPPTTPVLDERAELAIAQHNGLLDGCRGALRDYLAARVPPPKQFGYVQRVATVVNGLGFNWNPLGGDGIPPPARPGLVAAALNELLATGERTADPPMKWSDGDPRNLLTKLEILIKQSNREDVHERRNGRRDHRGRAPAAGAGEAGHGRGAQGSGRRSAFQYE